MRRKSVRFCRPHLECPCPIVKLLLTTQNRQARIDARLPLTLFLQDVIQRVETDAEDQPQAAQQKQTVRMSLGLNTPTLDRLTDRARRVLDAAEPIAGSWGHACIGTEHLLLARYRQPEGVAAQILMESGLPADKAEAAVGDRAERGSAAPDGDLPFTPMATGVFNGALASAVEMGHNYIGTEHLLIGLARGDGMAAEVLAEFALTEESLARKVARKLAGNLDGRGDPTSTLKQSAIKGSARKRTPATKKNPAQQVTTSASGVSTPGSDRIRGRRHGTTTGSERRTRPSTRLRRVCAVPRRCLCAEGFGDPLTVPERQAPVDWDRSASHIAGGRRHQEATKFRYFGWCCEPAHRLHGLQPGALIRSQSLFIDVLLKHRRVHGPRHHRIYSAAPRRPIDRYGPDEAV